MTTAPTASFTQSSSEAVPAGVTFALSVTRVVSLPAGAMASVGEVSVTVDVAVEEARIITPSGTATIAGADLPALIAALQALT